MELSQYLGRELKDSIASISVVQGTAKDSGNPYYALEISLINGYKNRLFLKPAEVFAWCNAFDQAQTQQQLDSGAIGL